MTTGLYHSANINPKRSAPACSISSRDKCASLFSRDRVSCLQMRLVDARSHHSSLLAIGKCGKHLCHLNVRMATFDMMPQDSSFVNG